MKSIFLIQCCAAILISNSLCAPSEISESISNLESILESIRVQSTSDSIEDGFLKLAVLENPRLVSGENINITKKSKDISLEMPDQAYQLERPPLEEIPQDKDQPKDLLVRRPKSSDIFANNFVSHDRWIGIARMILVPVQGYLESKFPMITPLVITLAVKIFSCLGKLADLALTSILANGSVALLPGKFFFCETSLMILKKILGLLKMAVTGLPLLYWVGISSLTSPRVEETWSSSWTLEPDVRSPPEENKSLKNLLVDPGQTLESQVCPLTKQSGTSSQDQTDLLERFITDWKSSSKTDLISNLHDTTWTLVEDFILNPLGPFTGMTQAEFSSAKTGVATWSRPIMSSILESLVNLLLMTYDTLERSVAGFYTDPKVNVFYKELSDLIKDLPPETTMSEVCAKVTHHFGTTWQEVRGHSKLLACYDDLIGFLKMIPGYWKITHVLSIVKAIRSHYGETLVWIKNCLAEVIRFSTKSIEQKERSLRLLVPEVAALPRFLCDHLREKVEFLARNTLRRIVSVKERILDLFDVKGLVRSFKRAFFVIVELFFDSLRRLILPLRTLDPLLDLLDPTGVKDIKELGERAKLASFWEAGFKIFSGQFLEEPFVPLKDLVVAGKLVKEEAAKILAKSFEFILDLVYVILNKFETKRIFHLDNISQEAVWLDRSTGFESCESSQEFQDHFRNVQTSSKYGRLEETRKESLEQKESNFQNYQYDKNWVSHLGQVSGTGLKVSETGLDVSRKRAEWLSKFFRSIGSSRVQDRSGPVSNWFTRATSLKSVNVDPVCKSMLKIGSEKVKS